MTTQRRIRYVAFLGMGMRNPNSGKFGYSPLCYAHPDTGEASEATPFVQEALRGFFNYPDDECYVIGTANVWKNWNEASENSANVTFGGRFGDFKRLVVPNGETSAQLIQLFELVRAAIEGRIRDAGVRPIFHRVHEIAPDGSPNIEGIEEIHVDVTHGFRIQPIIGLAAVEFVRASWRRAGVQNPPRIRVTYGAYEARRGSRPNEVAPIWDLSSIIDVARWNQATSDLILNGDSTSLARVLDSANFEPELFITEKDRRYEITEKPVRPPAPEEEELERASEASRVAREWFDGLAKQASSLARSMDVVLIPDILHEARMLGAHLDGGHEGRSSLRSGYPMLEEVVSRLEAWSNEVSATEEPVNRGALLGLACSLEGLRSALQLVRVYESQSRYSEMLLVLRETLITLYGLLTNRSAASKRGEVDQEFGSRSNGAFRKRQSAGRRPLYDREISTLKAMTPESLAYETLIFGEEARRLRNQIAHAGMKQKRDTPGSIIVRVEETANDLAAYIEAAEWVLKDYVFEDQTRETTAGTLFIISNHEFASWPDDQQNAAGKKWSNFVDYKAARTKKGVKLPDISSVKPSYSGQEVTTKYVDPILNYVLESGFKHVFINGEHRLVVALVSVLQYHGVQCWTGTTKRNVKKESKTAQSSSSQRTYVFDSFQDYPSVPIMYDFLDRAAEN